MKRFVLILLLSTTSGLFVYGQDRKVSFSLSFQPGFSYRTVEFVESNEFFEMDFMYNRPKFSYEVGIGVIYPISGRINVSSGVYFSELGYRYVLDDDNAGDINLGELKKFVDVDKYYFIDIPLMLEVKTIKKEKFSMGIKSGISLNFFTDHKVRIKRIFNDGNKEVEEPDRIGQDWQKVNFSGIVGIDFSYKLNDKIDITTTPNFRYIFLPVDQRLKEEANINLRLYNLGIQTGIIYSF